MNQAILAARLQQAHARTLAAAEVLADRYGLHEAHEALRAAGHKDPQVRALRQREAIADLLEALVDAAATGPAVPTPAGADDGAAVSAPTDGGASSDQPVKRGPGRPRKVA
jgi:hypothetical protein